MKKIIKLAVVSSTIAASFTSSAGPLVIYGEDNRKEVYEASEAHQKLARSAATMIASASLNENTLSPGSFNTSQSTLKDWFEAAMEAAAQEAAREAAEAAAIAGETGTETAPMSSTETSTAESNPVKNLIKSLKKLNEVPKISFCAEERFVNQPNAGICSGFLIAPDLIVTAGHCLTVEKACQNYKWVFDYKVDKDTQKAGLDIPQSNIYSCKQVVSGALNENYGLDFGVIQLDRDVDGREPLQFRSSGKVDDNVDLVLIGSPSGLPLKVAAGAKVRTNTHDNFFVANTDSYQGNSGSAVFDAKTGLVEGILVRGENDFVPNMEKLCFESNKCADGDCRGEDISRLTSIPEVALDKALRQVSVLGRVDLVKQIIGFNTWLDFYTANKVTALMEAARAGQVEVVKLLTAAHADSTLKDVNGNTTLHYAVSGKNAANVVETLKILIAKVDVNSRNKDGISALDVAQYYGRAEVVDFLKRAGAR